MVGKIQSPMNKETLIKIDFLDFKSSLALQSEGLKQLIAEIKKLYQQRPKSRLLLSLKIQE